MVVRTSLVRRLASRTPGDRRDPQNGAEENGSF
jgi:hypothetical protein